MSEWIEHDGKGMTAPAETLVHVKFRGGDQSKCVWPASHWKRLFDWSNDIFPEDQIVAYRIVSSSTTTPKEGARA